LEFRTKKSEIGSRFLRTCELSFYRSIAALCLGIATALAADPAAMLERAKILQQSGKLEDARTVYLELLASPRLDSKLEAEGRVEISRIHLSEGHYADALIAGNRAARIAEGRKDFALEGRALTVTGMAHSYLGEYAQAIDDFERSLRAAQATGDAASQVTRLNNLGNVLFYQGRYADAAQRYRDALKIVDAHAAESWNASRRQLTVANIAILYQRLGQYRNALSTYSAMQTAGSALPVVERAQLLSNMGALYRRLGDPVKAIETYHAAQSLYRASQMRNGEITVLNNIGIAQVLDLHAPEEALRTFNEALDMSRASAARPSELQSLLYRGETLFRLERFGGAEQDFRDALVIAGALQAPEDRWKALYGLARSAKARGDAGTAGQRAREAVAVIETIRNNAGSSTARGGFLADKRQVYDLLIDLQIRDPRPDASGIFRLMEQSRGRALKDRKGGAGARDLHSTAASLDPHTLVVEYWIGDDALAAVWISANASGVYSRSGIPTLRRDLAAFSSGFSNTVDRHREYAFGSDISNVVAGVLAEKLLTGDLRKLVIIPDRELTRVPFEVLPFATSGLRVLDRASVAYLPTVSLLRNAPAHRKVLPFWSRMMLAFADPAPGSAGASLDMPQPSSIARLRGAAAEVRDIQQQLDGRTTTHTGADARKEYLSNAAAYPILHLATHAAIDTEDAGRSYILFAPSRASQAYDYLFLKEVSTLNLAGVDLVTASACETQSGEFIEGEGVENFSQAFLGDGARGVVTSLWRVDDRATAALMRAFYGQLAGGAEAADALRQAKLEYQRAATGERNAPFYWAAFVLNGDPALRLPFIVTSAMMAGAALSLLGAALIGWHLVRKRR
jgi:tetratricopeptide (TPR) repeat protein